jgi:signal transduction histidine kinase
MKACGARSGALVLRDPEGPGFSGVRIGAGGTAAVRIAGPLLSDPGLGGVVLFDCQRNRLLGRPSAWKTRFVRSTAAIAAKAAEALDLKSGLIATIDSGAQDGWLVLGDIADMSGDYLDFGRRLGHAVGTMLDRSALLAAVEDGVAAQTRLALARDVHDGLAQFLAGAAMRLEAIGRSLRSGEPVADDLADLKRLVVEEQQDIRSFVSALRRGHEIALPDALQDLSSLAAKLGHQWSVDCRVDGPHSDDLEIPIRLHFDLQQLLREAVANAVRHGNATRVSAELSRDGDRLLLDVSDNGSGFTDRRASPPEPWSLKERIDRARGSLAIRSMSGETQVSISLPLAGGGA